MMDGAIDHCNFDASWGGGPTEWRRVAGMAQCFSVTMAHHEEPQIAAHLLASITNSAYLEVFHPDRDPLFYERWSRTAIPSKMACTKFRPDRVGV